MDRKETSMKLIHVVLLVLLFSGCALHQPLQEAQQPPPTPKQIDAARARFQKACGRERIIPATDADSLACCAAIADYLRLRTWK